MRQVVYGDVLILINFATDYIVLYFSGSFLHLKKTGWRLFLSSLLGGCFSLVVILFSFGFIWEIVLSVAACACLAFLSYGRMPILRFLLLIFSVFALSVVLGGAVTYLYALIDKLLYSGGIEVTTPQYADKKALLFLLYAIISGVLI